MNILRRLPLARLLLLCATVVAAGVSITAIALALGSSAKPPARPLAQAVHDALSASPVKGFSADVKLTNHLLEGAELASGNGEAGLGSNPLISGATGRLWVSGDGHLRLELQAEQGDTQVLYDGTTVEIYDAATNTLYRAKVPAGAKGWSDTPSERVAGNDPPSLAKIEEAIAHIRKHAVLPEAVPTNVGGRPAYTARVEPKEGGSLIGGAELSFDAETGIPLRAAIYSTASSSPVIELATSNVSYGAVSESVFSFTPPPNVKIVELNGKPSAKHADSGTGERPHLTQRGKGLSSIFLAESKAAGGAGKESAELEGLPKVQIGKVKAAELQTDLGTLLSFERDGVRYVVAGAVAPGTVEALARGL